MDSSEREFEIVRLIDHRHHVDAVAQWIFDQWGRANGDTLESIREMLLEKRDRPPAVVAVSDEEPIGALAFNRHLLSSKEDGDSANDPPDLWVNVLYVREDWRSRGVGSQLLVRALEDVRKLGTEKYLYVYTDVAGYYQRQGWAIERSGLEGGYDVLSRETQIRSSE